MTTLNMRFSNVSSLQRGFERLSVRKFSQDWHVNISEKVLKFAHIQYAGCQERSDNHVVSVNNRLLPCNSRALQCVRTFFTNMLEFLHISRGTCSAPSCYHEVPTVPKALLGFNQCWKSLSSRKQTMTIILVYTCRDKDLN